MTPMRTAEIKRKTAETDVSLVLNLDGTGRAEVSTGVGFFDHMLTLFSAHARFDINLTCTGDTQVDAHHSVEDVGIALGAAFAQALGDKRGIRRYGNILLPMDETLIMTAVDISGRALLCFDVEIPQKTVGAFDTELAEEFMLSFVRNAGITLHMHKLYGKNTHHILEGCFKSLGRALGAAASLDPRFSGEIPSTKGVL